MNSTIKPKPCKVCQSQWHSAMYHKPRKAIAVKTPLPSKRTRIKQRGKYFTKWSLAKQDWFETNPLPQYRCHYCGLFMDKANTTLDHRIPRSRAPELRYELSNLVPCCFSCNNLKGSIEHDKYPHNCH